MNHITVWEDTNFTKCTLCTFDYMFEIRNLLTFLEKMNSLLVEK